MEDINSAMGRMPDQSGTPNSQESFERAEFQKKEFLLDLETAKISRFIANTTLRKQMSYWASFIVTSWLGFVGYVIILNNDKFCLSDSVLNTLITTTTINVIGIILICFRDLFNGKSEITIK
ncbi:hypothetical protein K5L04_07095 [Flavobacterium psychrophilum]|jgi:hypothetical protein|uniref:hypothetical protein n=1 Tax=Flavobacterium psychrophilum TaxID=96345 RepID=UPI000B7C4136|nr:hypothetical protein [Flavobacterium psychrophilum]ELY1980209.1 hypothetical protein [Flavobacterium psychrophilum]MCB6089584.1 hypothetical protein [Flavobacterium psychrophilum]MCB6232207.1 hypothetical protein [Flavobacterium psychrophilum]MEB3380740.1 hypothetical protein [Flavobacterium psychrophilum]QZK99496.1 hypothetical protein K5L04_07095 [Flavobacterium psychrophilum]